jgi:RES domain-containing protein
MNVSANAAYAAVRQRFAENTALLRPWRGAAYRVTTLDYPTPEDILLGQGSYLHGGRWNAIRSFRAVYGSTSDVVAVAESRANAEYAGINMPLRTPRLLVTVELNLDAVVDLTQSDTLQTLRLTSEELRHEDWRKVQAQGLESFTQAIGRAIFDAGANGLLALSARVDGGANVVYFPQNRRRESEANVCEPEKLHRIQSVPK